MRICKNWGVFRRTARDRVQRTEFQGSEVRVLLFDDLQQTVTEFQSSENRVSGFSKYIKPTAVFILRLKNLRIIIDNRTAVSR